MERLTSLFNMKDTVGENPTKGLVVHKGSDVSINTQPEEERMQGDQIIETTDELKAQSQRNYEFQDKGLEAML